MSVEKLERILTNATICYSPNALVETEADYRARRSASVKQITSPGSSPAYNFNLLKPAARAFLYAQVRGAMARAPVFLRLTVVDTAFAQGGGDGLATAEFFRRRRAYG